MCFAEVSQSIPHIEKAWKSIYPDQVFEYQFLDETIAGYYQKEIRISSLLKVVTAIAVFIGCLGVYGLLSFVAAGRRKEISIRKILGASSLSILMLLSKEFLTLIVTACVLAWPVGWYIMHNWLENFSYQIGISPWVFILAGSMALIVAFITISFQTIKAAFANPVEPVRSE